MDDDPEQRTAEPDGPLTPQQVRDAAFGAPPVGQRGYNEGEVDALLDRIEAAIRSPGGTQLSAHDVRAAAFAKPPLGKRGYYVDDVDAFLDVVVAQLEAVEHGQPLPPVHWPIRPMLTAAPPRDRVSLGLNVLVAALFHGMGIGQALTPLR